MKAVYHDRSLGPVNYLDKGDVLRSLKCQPRDISILDDVDPKTMKRLRFDICADIRRTQGYSDIGLMKGAIQ